MINTIFYFVDTFDIYKLKLDNGEISPKTIVFVEDQQAIYKDGKRYGDMGYNDIKNKVVNIINNEQDAITAVNGAYDDTYFKESLNRIHDIVEAEQQRLSNLITQLDTEIQDKVTNMFKEAEWIRDNVAQNEYLHQDMTWIGGEINAYLQQVGYWTTDDQGNTITQWSKIQQAVDSIITSVNALTTNVDGRFIAVQSAINQSVDQKLQTARTDIDNIYAKGNDVNGLKQVVEWMYSGLKSSAGPEKSIAQLIAAGKNSLIGAISELRTQVEHLDDNYVSTASLETQVQNLIDGTISHSGFVSQSDLTSAVATINAKLTNPAQGIEGWSTMYNLVNTINGQINDAQAGLITRISTLEGDVQTLSSSGFATMSDVNGAITTAFASYSGGSGSGSGSSDAELTLRVTNLESAQTSLTSRVSTLEGDVQTLSQAGFTTQNDVNDAITRAFANYGSGDNSGDASLELRVYALENAGFISSSDLVTKIVDNKNDIIANAGLATAAQINSLGDTYLAKANLVAEITNKKNEIVSSTGLQLSSNLDSAVATLVASNGSSTKTQIELIASDAASSVSISANTIDARVNQVLVSGNATFKGDVEASSFVAGASGQTGIVVQSGSFNSSGADTSKVYFAYDSNQGAPSIFIYDGEWKVLSLTNAFNSVSSGGVVGTFYPIYGYLFNGSTSIPNNLTTLDPSSITTTTYYNYSVDDKYYTQQTADSQYLFSGTLNALQLYDELNVHRPNNAYTGLTPYNDDHQYMLQYLGIVNNRFIVAAIEIYCAKLNSRVYSNGVLQSNSYDYIVYSPNAVLSCNVASDGTISNVVRGASFMKGIVGENGYHAHSIYGDTSSDQTDTYPDVYEYGYVYPDNADRSFVNGSQSDVGAYQILAAGRNYLYCSTLLHTDNKVYDIASKYINAAQDDSFGNHYIYGGLDNEYCGSQHTAFFVTVSNISESQMHNNTSIYSSGQIIIIDLSRFTASGNDLILDSINYTNRRSMTYLYTATSGS